MEIHPSARRHGVDDNEILHAVANSVAVDDLGEDPEVPKAAQIMTSRRTSTGHVITDADIEALADEAERGYDPAELIARRGKRGRPTLGGAGPSTVQSVRIDPELNDEVAERAKRDGVSTADVIREALRRYLHAS